MFPLPFVGWMCVSLLAFVPQETERSNPPPPPPPSPFSGPPVFGACGPGLEGGLAAVRGHQPPGAAPGGGLWAAGFEGPEVGAEVGGPGGAEVGKRGEEGVIRG